MPNFKPQNIDTQDTTPNTRQIIDGFLYNFRGNNKKTRGNDWNLGGSSTSFLTTVSTVAYSIIPSTNDTYALGGGSNKWSNIYATKINNVTPKSGTVTYYLATSSGGATTTAVTFNTGILT